MNKREQLRQIINAPFSKKKMTRILKKGEAKIFLKNGYITIDCPYDETLIKKFHYLETIKFDRLSKLWEVKNPKDVEVWEFLLSLNDEAPNYYWKISDEATDYIKNQIDTHENEVKKYRNIRDLKRKKNINLNWKEFLKTEPFDFQKVGILFIEAVDGIALVGDEMGVGKSMQALGYCSMKNYKTIVVCPASLKYKWQREVHRHSYKKAVVLSEFDEDNVKAELADFTIINYEQLAKYEKIIKKNKFDAIIIDESHYIKNGKADRTRVIKKLFKKIKCKILLSGTAIKNRPIEFYTQLNFLRPDLFRSKEIFGLRYCNAQRNEYGKGFDYSGASNLRELYNKINTFYIRRLKKDVLNQLPSKTVNIMDLELTTKQSSEYKKYLKHFKVDFNKQNSGEGAKKASLELGLAKATKIKQFLSLEKIPLVIEFINKLLDENDEKKVVVFSQFIETQETLVKAFGEMCNSILGSYNDKKRNEEEMSFLNDPSKKVMIASTKAAGIGLDLISADTVIFLDMMWNPADMIQAEDRVFRIGQKNAVSIYYFNYLNTIEVSLWNILRQKLDIMGQVLDGKEANEKLTEEQVTNYFIEDILAS